MASRSHHRATVAASAATPTARVRALNDALRQSFSGGRAVITNGIAALPDDMRAAVLAAVQAFDQFDADNDPYGEHDFGAVEVGGLRVFWKIDCYDRALTFASPDPADPAVTCRVLTVMLADEY
jgi:hypothetical protein